MAASTRLIVLTLSFCGLALQPGAFAQIASPINAGLNSGNNGFGSSGTSAATPNFSAGLAPLTSVQYEEVKQILQSSLSQAQAVEVSALNLSQGLLPSAAISQSAPDPTQLARQLIDSGVKPHQATKLVSLMQSLAQEPSSGELADAINVFNRIVQDSNPEVLAALRANRLFVSISTKLRAARAVLGS